jgi:sporulation protein YlmC with PRC-barrel domain
MRELELDLATALLDEELVDPRGVRCGRVDDIELTDGDPPSVRALLTGPESKRRRTRGPMSWLLRLLDRGEEVAIPWSEVEDVTHVIKLKTPANELGLAKGDERLRPWLEKVPLS